MIFAMSQMYYQISSWQSESAICPRLIDLLPEAIWFPGTHHLLDSLISTVLGDLTFPQAGWRN